MREIKTMKEDIKEEHKHTFRFSHTAIEARGEQQVYMTIHYVICSGCGELREQTIIPRLEVNPSRLSEPIKK